MTPCLLCHNTETVLYYKYQDRTLSKCSTCGSVFVGANILPNAIVEKQRYKLHENNQEDKGYQTLVNPLIETIVTQIPKKSSGLDFESGPTPIITLLLRKRGYKMSH